MNSDDDNDPVGGAIDMYDKGYLTLDSTLAYMLNELNLDNYNDIRDTCKRRGWLDTANEWVVGISKGIGWMSSNGTFTDPTEEMVAAAKSWLGIKVKAKRVECHVAICLSATAAVPVYQTAGAAGCDLNASNTEPLVLEPGDFKIIPTGVRMAIPEGFEGQVRPRSGLTSKGVVAMFGTVDSDYRGAVNVTLANLSRTPFTVEPGMRIAQMVFSPVTRAAFRVQDSLDETVRGDKGYGSTGSK